MFNVLLCQALKEHKYWGVRTNQRARHTLRTLDSLVSVPSWLISKRNRHYLSDRLYGAKRGPFIFASWIRRTHCLQDILHIHPFPHDKYEHVWWFSNNKWFHGSRQSRSFQMPLSLKTYCIARTNLSYFCLAHVCPYLLLHLILCCFKHVNVGCTRSQQMHFLSVKFYRISYKTIL